MPAKIDVDISFNEPLSQMQVMELTGGAELLAYSLSELMAEKFRAMLQQKVRNRNRRQDVYDLNRLIEGNEFSDRVRAAILEAFLEKCRMRKIEPDAHSLEDPEIRKRSETEWDTMELEIGALPDFEDCYGRVSAFYRALPWG